MRAVIQRVTEAAVRVDGQVVGQIGKGFLVLLGVMATDSLREAEVLAGKVARLRVFEDDAGKMNLSPLEIGGEVLVVSQFTLCADIKKGNRPSFTPSAAPDKATRLYEYFMTRLRDEGVEKVEHGVFGADMQVSLLNDGPVTICMDTDTWLGAK